MAESSLSVDYDVIQREVATALGWPRDTGAWTSTHTSDFLYLLKRGLRWAYFPPGIEGLPNYEWTFLRQTGTITLATGTAAYDMADDFAGTILDDSVAWAAGVANRPLMKVSEDILRKQQSMSAATGPPKYYAIRPKAHDATTGQRFEMLTYPTATSVENNQALTFRYIFVPNVLTSVNKYPVGGAKFSELVLAACMASAELMLDDDNEGVMGKQFQVSMAAALRADTNQKANIRSPGA